MSSYYDDRRSSVRRRSDDYYDDRDTVYDNTRSNARATTAVVKRRSDSPEYDEEVRRDFSPPGGGYYRETVTRKSGIRPAGRARSYEDDRYDDRRSLASSRRDSYYSGGRRDYDDRRRRSRYESDYSSRSPSPRGKKDRRKSVPEQAFEALGLGALGATLLGKKNKSRSRSNSSDRRSNRSRRGGRGRSSSPEHRKEQLQQALKAAVLAGAASAFRARNEEGGWKGEKGKRVLTAALTAGGVDGFINRDKDPEKHKFRDTIGSALAGVATDRLVNGPTSRSQSRARVDRDGRPISPDGRSRSRSKIRDLAAGGVLAAAAKKATDAFRGRSSSRGRDRARSYSPDSYDSRSPPRGARSRSRSVIARGLSKVGLDSAADRVDPGAARERSRSRGGGRRRSNSRGAGGRYADDDYVDVPRNQSMYDPPNFGAGGPDSVSNNPSPRSASRSRALDPASGAMISRPHSIGPGGQPLSPPPPGYQYDTAPRQNGDPETDSESDLGHSTDDEKGLSKGRNRMLLSAGLATVATLHAGHSIHQTMEKTQARRKAIRKGTISKEEAKAHKTRDRMQEVASVGLAALGLKGAYSEWKETKETKEEFDKEKEKRERHKRKREARKMKYRMAGMGSPEYSNSAPTLSDPFYGGQGHDEYGRQQYYHGTDGPYMSGANGGDPYHGGNVHSNTNNSNMPQYSDDNPYGSAYGNYGDPNNYPPPPAQGGTGFPPPPAGFPPPPQHG